MNDIINMNDMLKAYTKQFIKKGLAKCNNKQILLFKRMYSPNNLDADINSIVDNMPEDKLDWAMQQVQRTLSLKREQL